MRQQQLINDRLEMQLEASKRILPVSQAAEVFVPLPTPYPA